MRSELEKGLKDHGAQSAPGVDARKTSGITARVHFYAVHNAGQQLRLADGVRIGKRPERMEGR